METVTLGTTNRTVSRLGFGGATAAQKDTSVDFDPARPADRDRTIESIQRALDLGINYFDTAAAYGKGLSESIFGEGLADTEPESIFLASKVGIWREQPVRESLEGSLKRLRRDWIDLLQVHGTAYNDSHCDRVLRPGGFLDQLEELKAEGLIKHIGFTIESLNPHLWKFLESGRFDVMQIQYNWLYQHPFLGNRNSGALVDAKERGLGTVTMRTITSGVFQGWINRVNPNNDFDYTPHLLQFVLSTKQVDVALLGMRTPEQVETNVSICNDTDNRIEIESVFKDSTGRRL